MLNRVRLPNPAARWELQAVSLIAEERTLAETVAKAAEDFEGRLGVRVEDKKQSPPKLHDLPSLQKLCSSRFGWSAAKTLEVAQELYDGQGKKIITYPRAEVRYLPESLIADVPVTAALGRASVIATQDAYRGESVKAVVVLRESHRATTSEQDILDWCREHMAVYKCPREVQFVDALPKSGSGKVMWRWLQEQEAAKAALASAGDKAPSAQ